ncbi:MAG TPA: hypothetical protein VL588_11125, partial [Bdellovibrionota bacterium]|nr:hypothetical protein [Bdellovibrionota bacterium]
QRQNSDSNKRVQDLETQFDRARLQIEERSDKDLTAAELSAQRRVDRANENSDHALSAQAESYKNLMARQSAETTSRANSLKKQIGELRNSEDSSLISPAASNAIYKQAATMHQKSLDAETDRNRRALDGMRDRYEEAHEDLLKTNQYEKTKTEAEHAAAMSSAQAVFNAHIFDTEANKDDALKAQRIDHDRELDHIKRDQARVLVEQRQRYEDVLQAQGQVAAGRVAGIRQDADFALRVQQRMFNQRMSEVSRGFEKRLGEQKEEFQYELAQTKGESERALLEANRQHRTDMENQAKDYEQRLAQAEMTHEEKQRSLAQNYEEQMEALKATNTRLARQKA